MQTLSTSYFGSTTHYSLIAQSKSYLIESKEHFIKQSQRNRTEIYSANGKLILSIPLKKWRNHSPIDQMEVSFDEDWQTLHWRSMESAYRASPFFEYYEDEIKPLIYSKESNLIKRNTLIEESIKKIIGIESILDYTSLYEKSEMDWRKLLHPKNKELAKCFSIPSYIQVFEEKHGFIPNLSILDLLFNLGPESRSYLNRIKLL